MKGDFTLKKKNEAFFLPFLFFCLIALFLATAGVAGATLYDMGAGLIYDSDLDIMWLQDANYARTSGYDTDGKMTWSDADRWANDLTYAGYSDWRLPRGFPDGGVYIGVFRYDGSTDWGYNVTDLTERRNEMAYLYYVELGNLGKYDTSGIQRASGTYGLINHGPFLNIETQTPGYWTCTSTGAGTYIRFSFADYIYGPNNQWSVGSGFKGRDYPGNLFNAWAVRDCDSAEPVPEPATMLLMGSGLAAMAGFRKRLKMETKA